MAAARPPEPAPVGRVAELDLRGKGGPFVPAAAYRALKRLPANGELAILTDYPPALVTLPDLAWDFGGSVVIEQRDDGLWCITIRRGGG